MIRLSLTVLFALFATNIFSQIIINYPNEKKQFYHRGDTIHVVVMMKLNPKSCIDGIKKTYIYFSGCEDIIKAQWIKHSNNTFQKDLALKIAEGKNNKAKMTITRNTDKESYFRQEQFNIQ